MLEQAKRKHEQRQWHNHKTIMEPKSNTRLPCDLQLNRMLSLSSEDITLRMALGRLIRIE